LLLVLGNDLDHALLQEIVDCPSCHANVAPHALRDDGGGDELVVRNLLLELLIQVLVEENGGVELLLLLALGPLLLLGLAAAARITAALLGRGRLLLLLLGGLFRSHKNHRQNTARLHCKPERYDTHHRIQVQSLLKTVGMHGI
jgi:hypothetical protein